MTRTAAVRTNRYAAEELLAAGTALTKEIVRAIASEPPDFAFAVGCCPINCDPEDIRNACRHAITAASRAADFGLDGWAAAQQRHRDCWFDVRDWSDAPLPIRPLYDEGHEDASQAAYLMGLALTQGDHVNHLEQRFWLMPDLIVVSTTAEGRRQVVHTIEPGRALEYSTGVEGEGAPAWSASKPLPRAS